MFPGNHSLPLGIRFPPQSPIIPISLTLSSHLSGSQTSIELHSVHKDGDESSDPLDRDFRKSERSSSLVEEIRSEEDSRTASRRMRSSRCGSLELGQQFGVSGLSSSHVGPGGRQQMEISPTHGRGGGGGFKPYRVREEPSKSCLPAFPIPTFPAVEPSYFDSYRGLLDVLPSPFPFSTYRLDDPFLLGRYPLIPPPPPLLQFPFSHPPVLPSAGIHSLFSPLLHNQSDLLTRSQPPLSAYVPNASCWSIDERRVSSEDSRRRRTSSEKDPDKRNREAGGEVREDDVKQVKRRNEAEQEQHRGGGRQETRFKQNNGFNNNCGTVNTLGQGQGQGLLLANQLRDDGEELEKCFRLQDAQHSSAAFIARTAQLPKPELYRSFLYRMQDEPNRPFVYGAKSSKQTEYSLISDRLEPWISRLNMKERPEETPRFENDRLKKKSSMAFQAIPVNGFCKNFLGSLTLEKSEKEGVDVVAFKASSAFSSCDQNLNVVKPAANKMPAHLPGSATHSSGFVMQRKTKAGNVHHNSRQMQEGCDGVRPAAAAVKTSQGKCAWNSRNVDLCENVSHKKSEHLKGHAIDMSMTGTFRNVGTFPKNSEVSSAESVQNSVKRPRKRRRSASKVVPKRRQRSRLDVEEMKLAQRIRVLASDTSDSEEQMEIPDDVAWERLVLISSGPPLKMIPSKRKMDFLAQFGLMTHLDRNDFKFHQEMKKRRIYHESLSPVQLEKQTPEDFQPDRNILNGNDFRWTDGGKEDRVQFLRSVGLTPTAPEHRKKLKSARRTSSSDRKRNIGSLAADLSKWVSGGSGGGRPRTSSRDRSVAASSYESGFKNPDGIVDLSIRSFPPVIPVPSSACSGSERTNPCEKRSRTSPSNNGEYEMLNGCRAIRCVAATTWTAAASSSHSRCFLETFSKSVPSKTVANPGDRCPATESSPSEEVMMRTRESRLGNGHVILSSSNDPPDWPGIGFLVSSYHRYQLGQRLECDVLKEQSRKMSVRNQELQLTTKFLSKHMSDLKQTLDALDEERLSIETAIGRLKSCFKPSSSLQ